jgi:glutamate-ammonia-ligase adenylyltransferase
VVLAHSVDQPQLMDDLCNIALFLRAEAAGLLPQGVGHAAADAYRARRRAQHRARRNEMSATMPLDDLGPLAAHRQAVQLAWRAVFG